MPAIPRLGLPLRALAAALLLMAGLAGDGRAQLPHQLLDSRTEVRSLRFRFDAGRSFPVARLQQEIALTAKGRAAGLRRRLGFLPFVTAPGAHPFSPLELQRDVARLRRFYAANGFLEPDIRYDVAFDADRNVVDVVLRIDEGRPLALDRLAFRTAAGDAPTAAFPDALHPAWDRFERDQAPAVGRRLGDRERTTIQSRALNWMLDRGYAFADARSYVDIDTAAARAALTIELDPGPRARVDTVLVEGNRQVGDDVLRRTLPLREGDWFSSGRLAEGQRRVFALDLFRLALADVPDQPRDSTVAVRLRVQENPPRLVSAEAGFSSEAGATLIGQWAHRNFMGNARTLQVTGTAETGYGAFDEDPDRRYQLGVSLRRPGFIDPRLTATVRPFAEYRDVRIDRSWQAGVESSLVYDLGGYRFVTVQHRASTRRVIDYNLTSAGSIDLFTLLALLAAGDLDDLDTRVDRSILSVAATAGRHDPTTRVRSLQARPSLEVTTPAGLNTIEWARADLTLVGQLPLTDGIALTGRAQAGRMLLYGRSRADEDDVRAISLNALLLREVLFTAGGTGSVRGWGWRTLGPKWPDVRVFDPGTDDERIEAVRYLPLGGLSRVQASLELRLPFPGVGESWGTHVFLDGARIGGFEGTFQPEGSEAERGAFFGTGLGLDLATPVGPLRLGVGYKLNPSRLDLRRPADVLDALLDERPIESAPVRRLQRFHVHLSIGQAF